MNSQLLYAAAKVIPSQQILVNVVSRRVRQLCMGHRPMVEFAPGLREADIALLEIIEKKLTWESTGVPTAAVGDVVPFVAVSAGKKKAA